MQEGLPSNQNQDSVSRRRVDISVYQRTNLFIIADENAWDLAAFMFTHIGVTSSWNCSSQAWFDMQSQLYGKGEKVIEDPTEVLDIDVVERVFLRPLLLESIRLSQDLHRGIGYINGNQAFTEDFTMSLNAFTPFPKARSPALNEFMHRFHRPFTLDKFLDAFMGREHTFSPKNTRYLDRVQAYAEIAEASMAFPKTFSFWDPQDMEEQWHVTVNGFLIDCKSQHRSGLMHNNQDPNTSAELTVTNGVTTPDIRFKLKYARDSLFREGAVKQIFSNILDCALGIHEIIRVRVHVNVSISHCSPNISVCTIRYRDDQPKRKHSPGYGQLHNSLCSYGHLSDCTIVDAIWFQHEVV